MKSKIKAATVYLGGAQVTRTGTSKLKKGTNTISFSGLPPNIDADSITVSADERTIFSVTYGNNYAESADGGRIDELTERLERLQKELDGEQDGIETLRFEEELLKKNSMVENGKTFRASDIKESVVFFRERMTSIAEMRAAAEDRMERLEEEMSSISSEIGTDRVSRERSEVTAEIFSETEGECVIELSYFTYDAGWSPYYDIRVEDVGGPVTIQSKATVRQQTGEDWDVVALTLSTGNPSLSGDIPNMEPWYIDIVAPMMRNQVQAFGAPVRAGRSSPKMMMADAEEMVAQEPSMAVRESMTSVEYELKAPYTIETSGKGRSVDIDSFDLPAEYVYKSVRKLEKDVFLVAEIKEWESVNLIEGEASVFFEGRYVGKTYIDTKRADGALTISLGRDSNVTVARVKGKDFLSKPTLGSTVKASREWELTARNLKKQTILLILEDQIPVSVNKDVTVNAVNVSGAELDKDTGKLTWRFELEPAGSKKLNVKYDVTYPKNETVRLE